MSSRSCGLVILHVPIVKQKQPDRNDGLKSVMKTVPLIIQYKKVVEMAYFCEKMIRYSVLKSRISNVLLVIFEPKVHGYRRHCDDPNEPNEILFSK